MDYQFTRIASLVLAFGFFFSCTTLDSSQQNVVSSSQNLTEQQIQQRVDSLNQRIAAGERTPAIYYQKGDLLSKLARKKEEPSARKSIYAEAHNVLMQATDLYNDQPESETNKVQELLKVNWSNEHNQGVQIFQRDTSSTDPNYTRAADHFTNATIIIPDSAVSYTMGAKAYYRNKQPQKAINMLQQGQKNISTPPPSLLEQLAFLYMENGQPQKAAAIYEQAESFSSENINLLHGLSNAYINAGKHEKAVELLQRLIDKKPENAIYRQSLATELYLTAAEKFSSIISGLREGQSLGNTSFGTADSLFNQAKNHFQRAMELQSNNQELMLSFANFYQNGASKYQQLLPYIAKSENQELQPKIREYVSSSVPLFEQLAEQNPDQQQYWHNLYKAYSYLGMEQEAENVKSNF